MIRLHVRAVFAAALVVAVSASAGATVIGAPFGDGGPSWNAQFACNPLGGIVDSVGLIVADTCGHVVRRYNPSTSSMEHLGGSGSATIPSDAMLTGVIDKYAAFPSPSAVLVFGSYRYLVALPTLNAVRGVVSDGTVFNVMGDGSASCTPPAAAVATKTCLVTPRAMLLLPDDSILVSEQHAHRVRLWNNGYLYTYAGTGAPGYSEHANATLALFNQPTALALYPGGFILICDTNNHAIRFVAADGSTGTMVGTGSPGFAGDGTGTLVGAMLSSPTGVAVYITGETYIADTGNCRIRKVVNDVITTVAGSACGFGGDNGPAASALLANPTGIFFYSTTTTLVIFDNNRTRLYSPSDGNIFTYLGVGSAPYVMDGYYGSKANLQAPTGVVVTAQYEALVSDTGRSTVRFVDTAGLINTYSGTGSPAAACPPAGTTVGRSEGNYRAPGGLAVRGDGWMAIADPASSCLQQMHLATGNVSTLVSAADLSGPVHAVVHSARTNVTAYSTGDTIMMLLANGTRVLVSTITGCSPRGLAFTVDGSSRILVSCMDLHMVLAVAAQANGAVTQVAGTGVEGFTESPQALDCRISKPRGVAQAPSEWSILFVDGGNSVVRRVDAGGYCFTIAGLRFEHPTAFAPYYVGVSGYNGLTRTANTGEPLNMAFRQPTCVTVTPEGLIFACDTGNNRIVRLAGFVDIPTPHNPPALSSDWPSLVAVVHVPIAPTSKWPCVGTGLPGADISFQAWVAGYAYYWNSDSDIARFCDSATVKVHTTNLNASCVDRVVVTCAVSYPTWGNMWPAMAVWNAGRTGFVASVDLMHPRTTISPPAPPTIRTITPNAVFANPAGPPLLNSTTSTDLLITTALTFNGSPDDYQSVRFIQQVNIAGIPCGSLRVVTHRLLECRGWNSSSIARSTGSATVVADVEIYWGEYTGTWPASVTIIARPTLALVSPNKLTQLESPDTSITISGTGLCSLGVLSRVTIGGLDCTNAVCLDATSGTALKCRPPAIAPTAPGYPQMRLVVFSPASTQSLEDVFVTYPPALEIVVGESGDGGVVTALAAQPVNGFISALTPAPVFNVTTHIDATCSLLLVTTSLVCPPVSTSMDRPAAFIAYGSVVKSLQGSMQPTTVRLTDVSVAGPSGCSVNASLQCTNTEGRVLLSAPLLQLVAPSLVVAWVSDSRNLTALPTLLPTLQLTFATQHLTHAALPLKNYTAAWVDCSAVLSVVSNYSTSQSISRLRGQEVLSSDIGEVTGLLPGGAIVQFSGIDAAAARLNTTTYVWAECRWVNSERLRLPPITVHVPAVVVETSWDNTTASSAVLASDTPAYYGARLRVDGLSGSHLFDATNGVCTLRISSSEGVTMASSAAAVEYAVQPDGSLQPALLSITVRGAAAQRATITLSCTVFGSTVVSSPLPIVIDTLRVVQLAPLPAVVFASDATAVTPEPLRAIVGVIGTGSPALLTDVVCSMGAVVPMGLASDAIQIVPIVQAEASAFSGTRVNSSGSAVFPAFGIKAPITTTGGVVVLQISCVRDNGVQAAALSVTVATHPLELRVCGALPATSLSQEVVPAFSVTILPSCGAASEPPGLPPVSCGVSRATAADLAAGAVNASAGAGPLVDAAANTSVFLQGNTATHAGGSAVFNRLAITSSPGFSIGLKVSCTIGVLTIPTPIPFAVAIAGCPAGKQLSGVFCATCAGNQYSLGGAQDVSVCRPCPASGVACENGIIVLQPNFYRAPSSRGLPIDSTTQLLPCFNAESCTVNSSTMEYGCSHGYTGPLCGVCDESIDYTVFGQACRQCWPYAVNVLVVFMLVTAATTMLVYVALRPASGERKKSAIALRVLLSYCQAVGSLKAFQTGGTQLLKEVLGPADTVSASPFAIPSIQCLFRPTFITTYSLTVALPVMCSGAVIAIYYVASFLRGARPLNATSTGLFVLYTMYMPIFSSSLRVLGCSEPIDGVSYLRNDLRVVCGEGPHAIAVVVAILVLIFIGCAFPLYLFWLLASKTSATLEEPTFHRSFGSLYDGFRANARASSSVSKERLGLDSADDALRGRVTKACTRRFCPAHTRDHLRWFESVVLMRKALVVLLAVLVTDPFLQCAGAVLLFSAAGGLQLRLKPYASTLFNAAELLSLSSSLVTAVLSTALLRSLSEDPAFAVRGTASLSPRDWGITIAMALVSFVTLALLGGLYVYFLSAELRSSSAATAARLSFRRLPADNPLVVLANPAGRPAEPIRPTVRVPAAKPVSFAPRMLMTLSPLAVQNPVAVPPSPPSEPTAGAHSMTATASIRSPPAPPSFGSGSVPPLSIDGGAPPPPASAARAMRRVSEAPTAHAPVQARLSASMRDLR